MAYMVNDRETHDIGRKGDEPNKVFHGHLQDLAVFGSVLTNEEIAKIYCEFSIFSVSVWRFCSLISKIK